jgi:hypothetical protein
MNRASLLKSMLKYFHLNPFRDKLNNVLLIDRLIDRY